MRHSVNLFLAPKAGMTAFLTAVMLVLAFLSAATAAPICIGNVPAGVVGETGVVGAGGIGSWARAALWRSYSNATMLNDGIEARFAAPDRAVGAIVTSVDEVGASPLAIGVEAPVAGSGSCNPCLFSFGFLALLSLDSLLLATADGLVCFVAEASGGCYGVVVLVLG